MYSYDRTAATLDKSVLEKFQKDLKVMTKIYRSIDADKMVGYDIDDATRKRQEGLWDEARDLFRKFKDKLDAWTYKVLLPHIKAEKESYMEKKIRSEMWTGLMAISSLFPTMYDHRTEAHDIRDWSAFRRQRESNVKRYQVAFTKAFKSIEEYFGDHGGSVEREEAESVFEVAGMTVIVRNQGKSDRTEDSLPEYLRELARFAGPIRKAGFGRAIDGMKVVFSYEQKGLIAGTYQGDNDELIVYPLGLDETDHSTLTHETGHRFWYRNLPPKARSHWTEVIDSRSITIEKSDVDRFFNIVNPHIKEDDYIGQKELIRLAIPEAEGLEEQVKFREMSRAPIKKLDQRLYDPSQYKSRLHDFYEGEKLQLEEISEYANTSAVEAFAECFMLTVTEGPNRLGPFVRNLFQEVCRAGGARLASAKTLEDRVLYRYIDSR